MKQLNLVVYWTYIGARALYWAALDCRRSWVGWFSQPPSCCWTRSPPSGPSRTRRPGPWSPSSSAPSQARAPPSRRGDRGTRGAAHPASSAGPRPGRRGRPASRGSLGGAGGWATLWATARTSRLEVGEEEARQNFLGVSLGGLGAVSSYTGHGAGQQQWVKCKQERQHAIWIYRSVVTWQRYGVGIDEGDFLVRRRRIVIAIRRERYWSKTEARCNNRG